MLKQRLVVAVGMMAVLAVIGFGCGGSDDSSSPLVGTWIATMGADNVGDPDVLIVLMVNSGGTFSTTENGVAMETGTWATDGNKLLMSNSQPGQTLTYSVNGNAFTITVTNANGTSGSIVFTRV